MLQLKDDVGDTWLVQFIVVIPFIIVLWFYGKLVKVVLGCGGGYCKCMLGFRRGFAKDSTNIVFSNCVLVNVLLLDGFNLCGLWWATMVGFTLIQLDGDYVNLLFRAFMNPQLVVPVLHFCVNAVGCHIYYVGVSLVLVVYEFGLALVITAIALPIMQFVGTFEMMELISAICTAMMQLVCTWTVQLYWEDKLYAVYMKFGIELLVNCRHATSVSFWLVFGVVYLCVTFNVVEFVELGWYGWVIRLLTVILLSAGVYCDANCGHLKWVFACGVYIVVLVYYLFIDCINCNNFDVILVVYVITLCSSYEFANLFFALKTTRGELVRLRNDVLLLQIPSLCLVFVALICCCSYIVIWIGYQLHGEWPANVGDECEYELRDRNVWSRLFVCVGGLVVLLYLSDFKSMLWGFADTFLDYIGRIMVAGYVSYVHLLVWGGLVGLVYDCMIWCVEFGKVLAL
eukprot:gene3546-2497_t